MSVRATLDSIKSHFWSVTFFALLALVLLQGVFPALLHLSSDFPNYYAAARLLISGQAGNGLYDNGWFGAMAERMGLPPGARFIPFPPPTIFLMAPIAWLGPLNALRVWTVINVVLGAYSIRLLSRLTHRDWRWCGAIVLLSGHAIINNFKFGQAYLALMLSVILFMLDLERRKQNQPAVWLGIGIAVKYFPAVYIPLLVLRREWRVLTGTAAVVVLLWVGAGWFVGPATVIDFLTGVAAPHLQGNIVGQSNDAVLFQSWNSLLRRIFVYDPLTNPRPLLNVPAGYASGLALIYCVLAYIFGLGWRALAQYDSIERFKHEAAFITVAAFVILPATATYHALLLAPALVLYLAPSTRYNRFELATLLSYVAIGFFPYSWTLGFVERGWLLPLAYPRLWLICGMFIAMTMGFRKRFKHERARAETVVPVALRLRSD